MDNTVRTTVFGGLNELPAAAEGEMRYTKHLTGDNYPFLSASGKKESYTIEGKTAKDYLAEKGYALNEVVDIHEHMGEMAVLWLDDECKMYFLYNGNITELAEGSSDAKMVSCGEKIFISRLGAVFDGENEEFTYIGDDFSIELPFDSVECLYIQPPDWYKDSSIEGDETEGAGYREIQLWSKDMETLAYAGEKILPGMKLSIKFDNEPDETYGGTVTSCRYEEGGHGHSGRYSLDCGHLRINLENAASLPEINSDRDATKKVTVTYKDYSDVVAWKNRLWSYDKDNVRGSKLEIFNEYGTVDWDLFENTEIDSISRKMWSGGYINAIAALTESIVFFHENYISVLSGNTKSTLYARQIAMRGIEDVNSRSVAVCDDTAYYLSSDGVYALSGGYAHLISPNLRISGTDAVGGCDGRKYYISVKNKNDEWNLYVYDILKRLWHREDSVKINSFTRYKGKMYMTDGSDVYTYSDRSDGVEWEAVMQFDEGTWKQKKYKSIAIHGVCEDAFLYIKCDTDEQWRPLCKVVCGRRINLPYTEKCEMLHVKICGCGRCEIRGIERTFEIIGAS